MHTLSTYSIKVTLPELESCFSGHDRFKTDLQQKALILFLCLLSVNLGAQTVNDWWYFGDSAGLHFTSSGPVPDTNSSMTTMEGCASISNESGDLLFYSNGVKVYNAQHEVMPNGDSLLGNSSSTQSSVIVPLPGVPNHYYLFTVSGCTGGSIGYPFGSSSGRLFAYSVINMCLDDGRGDIIQGQKNIILHDSSAEKLTVSPHANGTDLWVIGMIEDQYEFRAYQLTTQGIINTVVSQHSATLPYGTNCGNYLLANHAGNKIASGSTGPIELFDFDQSTGIVSPNPVIVSPHAAYSFHFSPNDTFLYSTHVNQILQYDLTASNIPASEQVVGTMPMVFPPFYTGAYSLGPDGKIYIARYYLPFLSVIENPNALGLACNYVDTAQLLDGRISIYGLPNSVSPQVHAIEHAAFIVKDLCFGNETQFLLDSTSVDSVFWTFGDSNNAQNTSVDFQPTHIYSDTGSFTVKVVYACGPHIDSASRVLEILPRQSLNLGNDTVICSSNPLTIDVTQPLSSYLWHDSSSAVSYTVTSDELVYVTLFGACDTLSDTIQVLVDEPFTVLLPPDSSLCDMDSFSIIPLNSSRGQYEWNDGSNDSSAIVYSTGNYQLTVTNGCGSSSDSIELRFKSAPSDSLLPNDTTHCYEEPISITRPNDQDVEYYWQDSSSVRTVIIDSSESLVLIALNVCGEARDTMRIFFEDPLLTSLGSDTAICDKDSIQLIGQDSNASYLWSTGDTIDSVWTSPESGSFYSVTVTKGRCTKTIERNVVYSPDLCPVVICDIQTHNVFTPNGDGINDRLEINSNCVGLENYRLSVYNRWGNIIWSAEHASQSWDGYVNGEPASEGVYFYLLQPTGSVQLNAKEYKGSFTLLR